MRASDMFIGTVLKALEVEDLVSCKGSRKPVYLARSFIRHADAPSVFDTIEDQSYGGSDKNQTEGDDRFYEVSDSLNDPGDSPGPSKGTILKTPSFTRIAGLLPDDVNQDGENNLEVTDTLDSFVKAQIVFIDSNSAFYDNVDKRVSFFPRFRWFFFCKQLLELKVLFFFF